MTAQINATLQRSAYGCSSAASLYEMNPPNGATPSGAGLRALPKPDDRGAMTRSAPLVDSYSRNDPLTEDAQHLAGFGMASGQLLRIEQHAVDLDVEDPFAPGHERQLVNDVLIVVEEISSRTDRAV